MSFKCEHCDKSFNRVKLLIRHVQETHPDKVTQYNKCQVCGEVFDDILKLWDHEQLKQHKIKKQQTPEEHKRAMEMWAKMQSESPPSEDASWDKVASTFTTFDKIHLKKPSYEHNFLDFPLYEISIGLEGEKPSPYSNPYAAFDRPPPPSRFEKKIGIQTVDVGEVKYLSPKFRSKCILCGNTNFLELEQIPNVSGTFSFPDLQRSDYSGNRLGDTPKTTLQWSHGICICRKGKHADDVKKMIDTAHDDAKKYLTEDYVQAGFNILRGYLLCITQQRPLCVKDPILSSKFQIFFHAVLLNKEIAKETFSDWKSVPNCYLNHRQLTVDRFLRELWDHQANKDYSPWSKFNTENNT